MMQNFPIARELVLAGGGHSHVILLKMLAMNPIPGLKVTLVSPETSTPYSGMLPGLIAGHYERDECHIDLVPLCRFAGADFIRAAVTGVDPVDQVIQLEGRPDLHYDALSIDVGCTPTLDGFEDDKVIPVKPIGDFLGKWQAFLAEVDAFTDVAFVGSGAGGVELCLAVHQNLVGSQCRFHLITDSKTILNEFPAPVRIRFEKLLNEKRIEVHRDFRASMRDGQLVSTDGRELNADRVFCVTQASSQPWFSESGLPVDDRGFIETLATLQTARFENVFAVGDCATQVDHPRPKAGVFAVRQGGPLFHNIRDFLYGRKLKAHKPQSRYLALITTGPKHAVACRNGLAIAGNWVWQWKNWIDRKFIQGFADLPDMEVANAGPLLKEFDDLMHCGGCGSKVSADLLSETIGELLGDDAPKDDAALVEVPPGMNLVQSVDHFRSMVDDPYTQARIAVCHALSDVYACGGQAASALVMLTLPFGKPDATRSLLRQLMSGAVAQLLEEGAQLIGGHTSEGVELSIGLTANGLVEAGKAFGKSGLQPGDDLILTKPLGTGTVLAANMQYRAKGEWVEAAMSMMLQSNRRASEILRGYATHACTDITGFGLAGHCQEMLAEGVGMTLDMKRLPVLPGAMACLDELKIKSSLHEANKRSVQVRGNTHDIIYDPQTSGGLLAGVPAAESEDGVNQLREAGYDAAIIGEVTEGGGLNIVG